jgi:hypothetical protein
MLTERGSDCEKDARLGYLPGHASPGIGPDFDHRLTLDTRFVFEE